MRVIEFRGKRVDNGEWAKGFLLKTHKDHHSPNVFSIFTDEFSPFSYTSRKNFEVFPETVGQFTGLLDKNGTKIFEGDLIGEFDVIAWCNNRNGWAVKCYDTPTKEVVFCNCYRCESNFEFEDCGFIEVIGSIHEGILK